MKIVSHNSIIDKLKDRLVDGCLLYDGTICLLAMGLAASVVLSYGSLSLG